VGVVLPYVGQRARRVHKILTKAEGNNTYTTVVVTVAAAAAAVTGVLC
jgi:hypothetical protein